MLSRALDTVREGERLESSLGRWFTEFEAVAPGPLYSPQLSKLDSIADSPESGKLFPVAFHFSSFPIGQILVYYWIGVMIVQAHTSFAYLILSKLVTRFDSTGRSNLPCTCEALTTDGDTTAPSHCLQHFTMASLPPLGKRKEWPWTTAYNLCQSTEYFLDSGKKGFGPATVIPALALVSGYWAARPEDWSRHRAWVAEMLCRIRSSGNGIAGTWSL
jgi:hypothetical protein